MAITAHSIQLKPGYKQTEVGVIPKEWEVRRLESLISFVTSGSRGWARYYSDRGPIFLRIGNLSRTSIDLGLDDVQHVSPPEGAEGERTKVASGDVLISITAYIGSVAVVAEDVGEAYVNQHIALTRPRQDIIVPRWLGYCLLSRAGQNQFRLLLTGGTKEGLGLQDVKNLLVPLPSLQEQRAIAAALSDVDALIASLDRLIAKKHDLKQSAMQQLLTGKIRLPGFGGEWEVRRLGEIAEVIMGQSPVGTSYNRDGDGYPLINGPTEFTDRYPIKIQWTNQPTKFCKNDDVLLCVRGSSTGRINIANDEYCIGRGIAAIRAKAGIDTRYITFQVDRAVVNILALTTGSTFPNIDGKSLRAIEFPLPSFLEQQAIATVLSDMDAEIDALEQRREKTRALKHGMMQELLTGKTRLR